MWRRNSALWIALPFLLLSCDGCNYGLSLTPPPADSPAEAVALAGARLMIGTGDIATCGNDGDEATAVLVDSVLRADSVANVETVVFTLGDHAYPEASEQLLTECYTPSWGDTAKLIRKTIRPSMGNHDWYADRGAPYYRYFGARAGEAGKGYYSYALGEWQVVVLNSELAINGSDAERDIQETWLRQQLSGDTKGCTLAYFHRPLFSSSYRQGDPAMRRLWDILHARNADLVLSGHDHHYERFLPQTPGGVADSVRGIEQILVGTGGASLRGFRSRFGILGRSTAKNSIVQIQGHFGVLLLTLGSNAYRSAFLSTDGRVWDRHGRNCH